MKRAELLARQFYELEVAERERLEGTLNWHATVQDKENESNVEAQRFKKFGISAGVELGSLNRFKNIFPVRFLATRLAPLLAADQMSLHSTTTRESGFASTLPARPTTSTPHTSSSKAPTSATSPHKVPFPPPTTTSGSSATKSKSASS